VAISDTFLFVQQAEHVVNGVENENILLYGGIAQVSRQIARL
jgi:hypothetical protein